MKNYLRYLSPVLLMLLAVVSGGGKILAQSSETYKFSSFDKGDDVTFKGTDCTISLHKNNGSTQPTWSSNQARLYPKGSINISSEKLITKVVFNYVENKGGKKNVVPTISDVTPGFDEATKTWTSEAGSKSVEMTLGGTAGNFGFTSLDITYAGGGSDKPQTTFAFTSNQTSFNYNVGDNDGIATLTNPAVLTPAEAGTISYSIENSTFDEGEIDVDETGEVMFSTDKAASATITATVSGIDETKYVAPANTTISYTVNVSKVKTQTTLSFGEAYDGKTISAELGEEFTAPTATLAPAVEGATIKYASSNTKVATVDEATGAVTLVAKGTATITASYEGNDDYAASEASYTLNVTKTVAVEDGVFDFTGDGSVDYGSGLVPRSDYSSTEYYANTTWTAGNVTITTSKATGNGVRWWKASSGNQLRVYSNSKMAISVPDGYVITNIDLGVYNKMNVDCGTLNNTKWTGASQVVTITPTERKDFKTITVKYVKTETLTTSAKGYATYAADYAVNYSELGLTAYTIIVNADQTEATASEFTGVVPAGKAVLVKGEGSKEYTLTPATADADDTFATSLQTGATTADGTQYGFTSAGDVPAFKKVTVGQSIAAKKGYLVLTSADAAAKLNLNFGGEATGIKAIEAAADSNAAIYNLAGQRVDKAYKGIVIVNGKKYLNK